MSDRPGSLRFGFVQWELAGRLGPAPGRYVVRRFAGDEARHVVVISAVTAPRRLQRVRRRSRPADLSRGPEPVDVTRATVVGAVPLGEAPAAAAWLERAAGGDAAATVRDHLAVLNQAVHGHRVATADPYVAEVGPGRALVTRIGYGSGAQTGEGRWEVARELGRPGRPPGTAAAGIEAQERLAALLAGRDAALACEELALRARLDLDHGRQREAALQTRVALEAALAELEGWRDVAGIPAHLEELRRHRAAVEAAARTALQGGLQPAEASAIEPALRRLEEAVRLRAASSR
jgi:hypothetical protein